MYHGYHNHFGYSNGGYRGDHSFVLIVILFILLIIVGAAFAR